MISLFRSTRPFSTSDTSTFFLHAFLPFLEGWLYVLGASPDPAGWELTTGISGDM